MGYMGVEVGTDKPLRYFLLQLIALYIFGMALLLTILAFLEGEVGVMIVAQGIMLASWLFAVKIDKWTEQKPAVEYINTKEMVDLLRKKAKKGADRQAKVEHTWQITKTYAPAAPWPPPTNTAEGRPAPEPSREAVAEKVDLPDGLVLPPHWAEYLTYGGTAPSQQRNFEWLDTPVLTDEPCFEGVSVGAPVAE